jgi:hypothetical protein
MIKKVKDGYKVVSEKKGKNLGGPYKTREEAEKRLRQVEFFKHNKGKSEDTQVEFFGAPDIHSDG